MSWEHLKIELQGNESTLEKAMVERLNDITKQMYEGKVTQVIKDTAVNTTKSTEAETALCELDSNLATRIEEIEIALCELDGGVTNE